LLTLDARTGRRLWVAHTGTATVGDVGLVDGQLRAFATFEWRGGSSSHWLVLDPRDGHVRSRHHANEPPRGLGWLSNYGVVGEPSIVGTRLYVGTEGSTSCPGD
jgi:hypothetical protein